MTSRQHTPLVSIRQGHSRLVEPVPFQTTSSGGGYDEAWIRDLIFTHPQVLPVNEIDPSFGPLIPVCRELDTRSAGFADALLISPLGMLTLVECKLWRNPEARREVVGQILDYARVLRRWTFTDLQREVARARKEQGFDLWAYLQEQSGTPIEQAAFSDAITRNLARGRILLVVLGDGIREGVEAIGEYIQGTQGLHFTFSLVEAQVFQLSADERIVQTRILARTAVLNRTVVDLLSPSISVIEADAAEEDRNLSERPTQNERQQWMMAFWTEFLSSLKLDDAEQPTAKPIAESNIFFMFFRSQMWLTCFFNSQSNEFGVFLGMDRTSALAMEIGNQLEIARAEIDQEFKEAGVTVKWTRLPNGKVEIKAAHRVPSLRDPAFRAEELAWFANTVNAFVNILRPRIRALLEQQLIAP